MPASRVYFVDFAGGNLSPSTDVFSWGPMIHGGSAYGTLADSGQGDPEGFLLSAFRPGDMSGEGVSNSVYVIPKADKLAVESRFLMGLHFDLPSSEMIWGDRVPPEPWAVGLKVKKSASKTDRSSDSIIPVTCQFQADALGNSGVRLNTPFALQADNSRTATALDSPLNYESYQGSQIVPPPGPDGKPTPPVGPFPVPFVLKFLFSGVQAIPHPGSNRPALGYVLGCGFLAIGTDADERLFSHVTLWDQPISPAATIWQTSPSIGAFGVSVVTMVGHGTIRARLRTFWVDLWPPANPPEPEVDVLGG